MKFQMFTPGFNFTNVLWAAFTCADPKIAKRHWWLDCLFTLLGSAHIKAARSSTCWWNKILIIMIKFVEQTMIIPLIKFPRTPGKMSEKITWGIEEIFVCLINICCCCCSCCWCCCFETKRWFNYFKRQLNSKHLAKSTLSKKNLVIIIS